MINGHKWFSSNGSIADFLIVMVVTDPDARPHQRASMLIVDADAPGVTIVRDVATMEHPYESFGRYGNHAEIVYEDVRVPADALLGAEGAGFLIAQQRLYPGRIHHCMRWLGVARRAFDMLCERSLYRYAHGSVLGKHETVQNWIADSEAEMHAARLMTPLPRGLEDGRRRRRRGPHKRSRLIQFYRAKVLHDVIDRALQVHGGTRATPTDLPLEAMPPLRARGADLRRSGRGGPPRVGEVARQVLRGYEAPPDGVPSEFIPARREAARERFAELLGAATAND